MIRLKVRKTIEDNGLIKKGDKILVAVSGGPDSVALLHVLAELSGRYGTELFVAHLNHMLRGKEADGDEEFVRKTAGSLALPFVTEKANVKNTAKALRMSVEEAAREVRYDFFNRAAAKFGASTIATGHTLDDQAETILMRLLKGSGSLGLSGIPYKRRSGKIWVVRPLLDVSRKEVVEYIRKNRIPARTDTSNRKTIYLRNKIRNNLIPILEKDFNPNIKNVLASMASTFTDESLYLTEVAAAKAKRICRMRKGGIELSIKGLAAEHAALQRLIVRHIIVLLNGSLKGMTYKHWESVESLIKGAERKRIDLFGRIKAAKNNGRIIFTAKDAGRHAAPNLIKETVKLKVPGEIIIPGLGIKIKAEIVRRRPDFKKKRDKDTEYVNGDLIGRSLRIRARRAGDRMKPLGMASYKKLQDIFVDEKISRERRHMIPIIVSGNKVLWAAGVKLSDEFKLKDGTRRIVKLSAINT